MLQKALTEKFTLILKNYREVSGLSQTDISEMLSIGLRSYQRYESGESSPSLEVTYLLSRILKFELRELFETENFNHIIPGLKIYHPDQIETFANDSLVQQSEFLTFINSHDFQLVINKVDIREIRRSQFFNSSKFPLSLSNPRITILNSEALRLTGFNEDAVQTSLGQDNPGLMGLIWANLLDTKGCYFEQTTYPEFPNGKSKMIVKGFYKTFSQNHFVLGLLDISKSN